MSEIIRFLDLSIAGEQKKELLRVIEEVIDSGQFVMGPRITQFENRVAEICQRQFSIGVSSGTDSLFTGLRALNLEAEDEIITTSISWIATANAIRMANARPVFADVDGDLNISVESVERLISEKTRAVLTVNFNGLMSRNIELEQICKENGIWLIEDAAQSFGASLEDRPAGSFGILSAMSHNPMKILGGLGEAGSILTDNEQLAERIQILRYNGTVNRESCVVPSLNSRLDSLQAAILLARIDYAFEEIDKRRINATIYNSRLNHLDEIVLPKAIDSRGHVYYAYTLRSPHRDQLKKYLEDSGVETKIMHPTPMPLHPAYIGSKGEWENAKKFSREILSLPIASHLTESQIEYIADRVCTFYDSVS